MKTKQNPILARTSILSTDAKLPADDTGVKSLNDIALDMEKLNDDFSNIRIAWPNLPTIRIDTAFAYIPDVKQINYVYFRAAADQSFDQLFISPDPDLAQRAKRDNSLKQVNALPTRADKDAAPSEYLSRSVSQAILRALHHVGWGNDDVVTVLSWMGRLGAGQNTPRNWRKYRKRDITRLSPLEDRVAEILKLIILAEVFGKTSPNVFGRVVSSSENE